MPLTGPIHPQIGAPLVNGLFQVLLAVSAFVFSFAIERRFDGQRAFDQYDTLFDADPNTRLARFAGGWYGDDWYAHPCIGLVSVPIRLATALPMRLGLRVDAPHAWRRSMALLIVPLCSAFTAVAMFRVFLGVGMTGRASAAGALFHQVSFSQIVFGSIPDHFALGGLAMALVLLAGTVSPTAGRIGWRRWIAAGVCATGVTITQVIPTCLVFAACCHCGGLRLGQTLRAVAILGITILAIALALGAVLCFDATQPTPSFVGEVNRFQRFFPPDPWAHAVGAATAIPNSIAPPRVDLVANSLASQGQYPHRFTLESVSSGWRIFAVVVLFLAGSMIGLVSDSRVHRGLCLGSISVVAYNLIFHSLWGFEWFLYSQHWLAAAVFVIASPLCLAKKFPLASLGAALLVIALVASNNWQRIVGILSALEVAPTGVGIVSEVSK